MNTVKNDDVLASSLDYTQNLQLQRIPAKNLLYLRQVGVYVFCVHDMKTQIGYLPLP
jgi:hypothetical protein